MNYLFVLVMSGVLTLLVGGALSLSSRTLRTWRTQAGIWGTALGVHVCWWSLPHLSGSVAAVARWLAAAWIASTLLVLVVLVPLWVWLFVRTAKGPRAASEHGRAVSSPSRAPRALLIVAPLMGAVIASDNLRDPIVREEIVRVSGLRPALDGMRIASVGDIHIGAFITPQHLARAITLVNERNVDALAITGDVIDDLTQLEATLDALELSRARPIIAVLGNHDKATGQAQIIDAARRRNRLAWLVDTSVIVHHRGDSVRFIGVDYALDAQGGHMLPKAQQDSAMRRFAASAFAGVGAEEHVIALSHHPEFFPIAAAHGAILTLASHTHGGQIALFGRPLIVAYEYMHGRYARGAAHLDVSAGVGHWLPVRVFVPREIVIVTLQRAS